MRDEKFFAWLEKRQQARPSPKLEELIKEAGGPEHCAVVVVDLVEGFCHQGALASPRIKALIQPICDFLSRCHHAGIETFLFPCDAHQHDSPEFQAFPVHCLKGSAESELVPELKALPFSHLFERLDKRSVSSLVETGLATRLLGDRFQTIFCLGDCTDLCLYHLATGLRYLANCEGLAWNIIVPANLVETYDLALEVAEEIGALPHPGDLLHDVFLYHLELNAVTVAPQIL